VDTLQLTSPPTAAAGITVKMIGMVNSHSICPVSDLPINPASEDNRTIARLVPIAILVGICTYDVIRGIKIKDPP